MKKMDEYSFIVVALMFFTIAELSVSVARMHCPVATELKNKKRKTLGVKNL